MDKSKFLDTGGRPLTQAMFLEINYDTQYSIYTLKDFDFEYEGKVYPSLKRLYLEMEDPVEYDFVTKHLLNWKQWQRLGNNKVLKPYIAEWREELELKLRSRAVRDMQNMCSSENGNFQATKFLADRGWDKRAAGRPSKQEEEKRLAIAEHIDNEFSGDVIRMDKVRNK